MLYRYKAIPAIGGALATGELSADSPVDVRTSLRRIGLQAIEVRPVRRVGLGTIPLADAVERHLRNRRRPHKAEILDALATMLNAGVPLEESLGTLASSRSRARTVLAFLRESIRNGSSLSDAMRESPSWFDPAEVAMVASGEVSGELPTVLRSLADRHQRSGELSAKLAQTLVYPTIVLIIGLGVAVFLSTSTLPKLVGILANSKIEPPILTSVVMSGGQFLFHVWWLVLLAIPAALLVLALLQRLARSPGWRLPPHLEQLTPRVLRQAALAQSLLALAELLRVGVPMTEALRITAPTLRGPVSGRLGRILLGAAERLEGGDRISDALDDGQIGRAHV